MEQGRVNPAMTLAAQGFDGPAQVYYNFLEPALVQAAVTGGEAQLGQGGAVLVSTGKHTGRSPKDKFFVRSALTENTIWWDNNGSMPAEGFAALKADMLAHLRGRSVHVQDLFAGADPVHRLDVRMVTELAWHALFIRHLLRRPTAAEVDAFVPDFTIINSPSFAPIRPAMAAAAKPSSPSTLTKGWC